MAVKVIKHGKAHYTAICPRCGCEFEYDLKDLGVGNGINCPDCEYYCYHPIPDKVTPSPWYPNWPNTPNIPDPYTPSWPWDPITKPYVTWESGCEGCQYYEQLKKGKLPYTVGDSPCTWCAKHQPFVYTNTATKEFKIPNELYTTTGNDLKVTLDGKDQKFDFNNLHAGNATVYSKAESPKESKKLDLGFSPEDIDLPQ